MEKYRELRRTEKRMHKAKKRDYNNRKFEELESLRHKIRKFYQNINKARKDFKPRTIMVRDSNSTIINDKDEIVNR